MNAGEAAEVLVELLLEEFEKRSDMERRIIANQMMAAAAPYASVVRASIPTNCIPIPDPMGDAEALAFENSTVEFGKYKGAKKGQVPKSYITYICDNSYEQWKKLWRYLNNPRVKRELREEEAE